MRQGVRQQGTARTTTSASPLATASRLASTYRWSNAMPAPRSSCSRRGSPTYGSPPDQRFEFDLNMAFHGPKELWAEWTSD
ncbi:MAG: hypothetical protein M3309_09385 [Actinomycetota bacterium]|nr:hypothetical protein [Actinomycetota bacterium]